MTPPLRDRVVVIFAIAIGAALVVAVAGVVTIRLTDANAELSGPISAVSSIITALIGFVVGSATGRHEE